MNVPQLTRQLWENRIFHRPLPLTGYCSILTLSMIPNQGGAMSRHKKIERKKELDRKRRRRERSLKLRKKEAKQKSK